LICAKYGSDLINISFSKVTRRNLPMPELPRWIKDQRRRGWAGIRVSSLSCNFPTSSRQFPTAKIGIKEIHGLSL